MPSNLTKLILLLAVILLINNPLAGQHSTFSLNDPRFPVDQEIPARGLKVAMGDSTLRIRKMNINPALQTAETVQEGDTLLLDLFPGTSYKAAVDRTESDVNGTWTLRAKIAGEPYAFAMISTNQGASLVTIEIPGKSEFYISRFSSDNGTTLLRQIDRTVQVPLEGAPPVIPDSTGERNPENPSGQGIGIGNDEGSQDIINVMVLYTPAADNWALSNDSGIENTIAQLMGRAQLACDNSNLFLTIKLAHSRMINYTEKNTNEDLYGLAYSNDGIMDEVQGLRNTYCADLVVLLENISFTGGLGFLLNNIAGAPDYGFSLTRVQQASWTYTTIHELGHNLGAHHHKQQNSQAGPGIFSYSAGWRWTGSGGAKYCSIMTYQSGSYFSDGVTHTQVGYFSAPEISYEGVPTGNVTEADNARTIRKTKSVVAAYRTGCCTPPTVQASGFSVLNTSTNSLTIGWTRGSGTEGVLVVGRARAAVSANPVCGLTYTANSEWGLGRQLSPSNFALYKGTGTSVTITGLTEMTEYQFAIFEYNTNGFSYLTPALTGKATTSCVSGSAPLISIVTQPTCAVPTGSILVSGLPSGSWTLYLSPGSQSFTGNASQILISGINPGTYTARYATATGCYSPASDPATVNTAPARAGTPKVESIVQPDCDHETGALTVSGLPAGDWILREIVSGQTYTSTGTSITLSGLSPGSYRFAVTHATLCASDTSSAVLINTQPETPAAPVISRIIHPDCLTGHGTIELSGLPATGDWILTRFPGEQKITGSGTTLILEEVLPGSYTYKVSNAQGCTSPVSLPAVVNSRPVVPEPPVAAAAAHPTCTVSTGSIELTRLPAQGTWTLTALPGGKTLSGSGTSVSWSGFEPGSWQFTVTHASGCTSGSSTQVTINPKPPLPDPPRVSDIIQPTCTNGTGTLRLAGLPTGPWILQTQDNQSFNGSGTSYEIPNVNPGIYSFRVTNESGCTSLFSAEAVVTDPPVLPVPVLSISGNKIISDAPEGNQWYNQYGKIEGATATEYTPPFNGEYYVVVTVGSCISEPSEKMLISDAGISMKIYPNPFYQQVNIELKGLTEECRYALINPMGRVMRSGKLTDLNTLDTSTLAAGLYILRIEIGKELIYRRLVKGL
jgi:hypothetical protein